MCSIGSMSATSLDIGADHDSIAVPAAGAPGSTIGSCDCPTGPHWEVQVAYDNGYDVELATDAVSSSRVHTLRQSNELV